MTENQETFIFDFDSTFIKVEALDVLCEVIYQNSVAGEQILSEIQRLTDLGMEGKLSLKESLTKRIHLLQANRDHLGTVIEELKAIKNSNHPLINQAKGETNNTQLLKAISFTLIDNIRAELSKVCVFWL